MKRRKVSMVVRDNSSKRRSKADKAPAAISGATRWDFPGKRVRPSDRRSVHIIRFICGAILYYSSCLVGGWGDGGVGSGGGGGGVGDDDGVAVGGGGVAVPVVSKVV